MCFFPSNHKKYSKFKNTICQTTLQIYSRLIKQIPLIRWAQWVPVGRVHLQQSAEEMQETLAPVLLLLQLLRRLWLEGHHADHLRQRTRRDRNFRLETRDSQLFKPNCAVQTWVWVFTIPNHQKLPCVLVNRIYLCCLKYWSILPNVFLESHSPFGMEDGSGGERSIYGS